MCTSVRAFVIFAVFQITFSTITNSELEEESKIPIDPSIPEDCYGPPGDINIYECCPLGPLFTPEDLELCGFKKPSDTAPWRTKDCSTRICIFKKNNLLNEDETINYAAMGLFMDRWSENYTNIVEAVAKAKEICFGKKGGPPVPQRPFASQSHVYCDLDKLLICLRSNIIWNCKQRVEISKCKKLAEHMTKCKQYLYKEMPTEES